MLKKKKKEGYCKSLGDDFLPRPQQQIQTKSYVWNMGSDAISSHVPPKFMFSCTSEII